MTRQAEEQRSMQKVSGDANVERTTKMGSYDQAAMQERMAKLYAEVAHEKAEERRKAAELAAVVVSEADVAVVAQELSLPEAEARRRLQERHGDVVAVLREAVHLPKRKENK